MGLYLALYGLGRFWVEGLRVDPADDVGPFRWMIGSPWRRSSSDSGSRRAPQRPDPPPRFDVTPVDDDGAADDVLDGRNDELDDFDDDFDDVIAEDATGDDEVDDESDPGELDDESDPDGVGRPPSSAQAD